MPAAHRITPEPVTNSGRGWREASGEGAGRRWEPLTWSAGRLWPWPSAALTGSPDCAGEFGRGFWLEDKEEALPPPRFLSLPDLQNAP